MKRRALIQAGLGLCSLTSLSSYAASRLHWQTTVFHGLGTTLSIRAAHHDVQKLDAALSAARSVVAHVEDQMSLFRPQSAINQLNREGELLHPDASLVHLLQLSQRISQQSRGAFDVTVQPLWALYDNAKNKAAYPPPTKFKPRINMSVGSICKSVHSALHLTSRAWASRSMALRRAMPATWCVRNCKVLGWLMR